MANKVRMQATVITGKPIKPGTAVEQIAFYDASGQPVQIINLQAVFVAQVATANATDLPTAQALANQNKTTINAILTALKNAGLMAPS